MSNEKFKRHKLIDLGETLKNYFNQTLNIQYTFALTDGKITFEPTSPNIVSDDAAKAVNNFQIPMAHSETQPIISQFVREPANCIPSPTRA